MKTYKHFGMILVIFFLTAIKLFSQDVQFSQFYTAKFNIAPSFAGTAEDGRFTLIMREQWPKLKNPFLTYGFALDYAMPALTGGLGFYAFQDHTNGGGYVVTNSGIQYSNLITLNHNWMFRPGMQINIVNSNIDLDKLTFGSQLSFDDKLSEPIPYDSRSITNLEAGASLLLYTDRYWFGLNINHLPMTRNSFSGDPVLNQVKFMTFGGLLLKMIQGRLLLDKTYMHLSYLFKYQNKYKQLDLGIYMSRKAWEVGVWYRGLPFIKNEYEQFNNSAIVFKAGMDLKFGMIGYSYDYSLSTTGINLGGAHEISMVYNFDLTDDLKKKKHKMVPSPRF